MSAAFLDTIVIPSETISSRLKRLLHFLEINLFFTRKRFHAKVKGFYSAVKPAQYWGDGTPSPDVHGIRTLK